MSDVFVPCSYRKGATPKAPPGVPSPRAPETAQENADDPIVYAKFFTPDSSWTWLALEFDPIEGRFFGFAGRTDQPELAELGYFMLEELETTRAGRLGLPIERDMYFERTTLSEAKIAEFRILEANHVCIPKKG